MYTRNFSYMLKENKGHIINIASQAGKLATPKSSGYSASKHAVLGFTNSLRMELAKTDIYVTAVNPGPIQTNFFSIADQSGNYEKSAEKTVNIIGKPKREVNLPKWMNRFEDVSACPGARRKIGRGCV